MATESRHVPRVKIPEEKWNAFMEAVCTSGVIIPDQNEGRPVFLSPRLVVMLLNPEWNPISARYVHQDKGPEVIREELEQVAAIRDQFKDFIEEEPMLSQPLI